MKIINSGAEDIHAVTCRFSSVPACFSPQAIHLDTVQKTSEFALHNLSVNPDYAFVSALSDRVLCTVTLELCVADQTVARYDKQVTACAADQWLGWSRTPENIAAFVTPNLDVIALLMREVSARLTDRTGDGALNGYQSKDRKRVYEMCASIYEALQAWGITYAEPPASFGDGQRVRFADSIYTFRLATCLDLTLLFASIMEQCGLHAVILMQKGHAYVGCHLVDEYFPDLPYEDLQAIRKRTDLDEFLVFETVCVTQPTPFSKAEEIARCKHLANQADFHSAIDIRRCRTSGVGPLPLKRSVDGLVLDTPPLKETGVRAEGSARELRETVQLCPVEVQPDKGRMQRWQQKLLDLSLRNRLLNCRDTKQVIPLVCPDLPLLEDHLASSATFSIQPVSTLLPAREAQGAAPFDPAAPSAAFLSLLRDEFAQKRLYASVSEKELDKRLVELYRQSRTDIEEGGVNTLFLALGFLEWREHPKEERTYQAPILLLPVKLTRKSVQTAVTVSRIDEETMVNVTLLEFLRQQFALSVPGLNPLPQDKLGVDTIRVMQLLRQAIKEVPGLELREEVRLGRFSFNKFVMWTDITCRVESLKANAIVRHIADGYAHFADGVETIDPARVEEALDLGRLYCPVSADSSQLTAVLLSERGKSFVLHGPPGTGKSQTITNIIAHNLACGRRVLFVSEKRAALEVVHKRLSAVGLKPFCLELHSNKSGKTDVLRQFSEVLRLAADSEPKQWASVVKQLTEVRCALNTYVTQLHAAYPNGISAYHCFSKFLATPHVTGFEADTLLAVDCLAQSAADYDQMQQVVALLANAFCEVGLQASQYWSFLPELDWTPALERDVKRSVEAIALAAEKLQTPYAACAEALSLTSPVPTQEVLQALEQLAQLLQQLPNLPADFLSDGFTALASEWPAFERNGRERDRLCRHLSEFHEEAIASLDCRSVRSRLQANQSVFFVLRFFRNRTLVKELSALKKMGAVPLSHRELAAKLEAMETYQRVSRAMEPARPIAARVLGVFWNSGAQDWDALAELVRKGCALQETLDGLCRTVPGLVTAVSSHIAAALPTLQAVCRPTGTWGGVLTGFLSAFEEFRQHQEAFENVCHTTFIATPGESVFQYAAELKAGLPVYLPSLRPYGLYRRQAEQAKGLGLAGLVAAGEDGRLTGEAIGDTFCTAFYQAMAEQIISASPVLREFMGSTQDARIKRFRELDETYIQLTRGLITARLAERLPKGRQGASPQNSELGFLQRECEKKARQNAVRVLLERIPNLLPVLKPCFLMSPLSVAQYLPADMQAFDVIVFDEASQIPVWDAIGVIARGKQLIVVGDPKQMPPTNFFQKQESEQEQEPEEEVAEDLESILDECLAAGLHSAYLNWHYRSRHESLISFSNHHYYEDRLNTFPSAFNADDLGVRFHFVEQGVYDRSNTRTNEREAGAIVRYVMERLTRAGAGNCSIGIVTFSQAQKERIEDLLDVERQKHPELERHFSEEAEEPLFVKNLENVQGDERDMILFSVGYAADQHGRLSMNFGPLNRKGGERRLNVAITRAKKQVWAFSSIRGQQIDLTRISREALGVAHLRYFLEYAEKGLQFVGQTSIAEAGIERAFEDVVAAAVVRNGYEIRRNVGTSGYKIDMAVVDPDDPARHLLGIECDGQRYCNSATGRDRDHLRQSVLKGLGWHLYRIWITDWWHDPEKTQRSLLAAIEGAGRRSNKKPCGLSAENHAQPEKARTAAPAATLQPSAADLVEQERVYAFHKVPSVKNPECFYEAETATRITGQFEKMIQAEGPIAATLLKKRMLAVWGFTRGGPRIDEVLEACLPTSA
ncbi:MAG: DUF3320 domain-containing protein, partial [bacterium]